MSDRKIRYGRGKFAAHPNYIKYMHSIVCDAAYAGMPDATSNGRVNWQVSSGKSTSFYRFYEARKRWWIEQADRLHIPGTGDAPGRLSITARVLHPTKQRVCRLCGHSFHVGYMYLTKPLAERWNKQTKTTTFKHGQDIRASSERLTAMIGPAKTLAEIKDMFPERSRYFRLLPNYRSFFEKSYAIQSRRISPGFMANPPDRLDGFHDYCLPNGCRAGKDPGRSDKNLRSYSVDRRVFEWWSEGDWAVAQALFNSAGPGRCTECAKELEKVSPDHVGPLACGFKQIPWFVPLCAHHQAAKNRRLSLADVRRLLEYERTTGESVASRQVRTLWDCAKGLVRTDPDARLLSNVMRSVQDYYMRALGLLLRKGYAYELSFLLAIEELAHDVVFERLDTGRLTFASFTKTRRENRLSKERAGRIVRVAFESLLEYNSKLRNERRLVKLPTRRWLRNLRTLVRGRPEFRVNSPALG